MTALLHIHLQMFGPRSMLSIPTVKSDGWRVAALLSHTESHQGEKLLWGAELHWRDVKKKVIFWLFENWSFLWSCLMVLTWLVKRNILLLCLKQQYIDKYKTNTSHSMKLSQSALTTLCLFMNKKFCYGLTICAMLSKVLETVKYTFNSNWYFLYV